MKVYLSVDLEGVASVVHPVEMNDREAGPEYQRARRLMTLEANAAIEAAFAAGATEVLVNDSHGAKRNLLPELLDRRARLLRGTIKPSNMMEGIDATFAAALFVGYHARAGGSCQGVLNHTFRGTALIQHVSVDGVVVGELGLNAMIAGHHGVPVVFVSGDAATCDEAVETLGAGVATVSVKQGIDRMTAICLAPDVVQEQIRATVGPAIEAAAGRPPVRAGAPCTVRCEWGSTTAAHLCSWLPGVRQVSPTTTEFVAADMPAGMAQLQVMLHAAAAVIPA